MTMPAQEAAPTVAERRAARRANQTTFNLVIALIASLGVVALLVAVVIRPDVSREPIDYIAVGTAAQGSVDEPLAIPELPDGWSANRAEFVGSPADGVTRWEVGFLTPAGDYIGLVQGIDANASWLTDQVRSAPVSDTQSHGGLRWDAHDRREVDDPGNVEFALVTETGSSTIVLGGTASDAEFAELATAVAESLS